MSAEHDATELQILLDHREDEIERLRKWEQVFGHLGTPDAVGNEWHHLSDEIDRLRAELAEKTAALQRESLGASNLAALLKVTEKERDEARRLLDEAEKYVIELDVKIDGEWGSCREADELEKDGDLSEIVYKIRTLRNGNSAPVPAQPAVPDDVAKDAACWRQLVTAHKFNNNPAVGFAINRAKEKAAILHATEGRKDE